MKKYLSLDGLRVILAIGIILMHIQANTTYQINGYIYNNIIPSFTNFVYLFMIISGFSMCCGYYDKIKYGKITPAEFYKKRIIKTLPFFLAVTMIEIVFTHSFKSLIEGFMNFTLLFGFLPNEKISVIGVGWFIGIVFIFYIFFPFFVYLLNNKKKAWLTLGISLLINILCQYYFFTEKFVTDTFTPRHNFLYDLVYFVLGGIIFLYKDNICKFTKNKKIILFPIILLVTIIYFFIPDNKVLFTVSNIVLFTSWLIFAISYDSNLLSNKVTGFISGISMEIYLSHMIIFRMLEKMKLTNITNIDVLNYIITCGFTMVSVIIFSLILKKIINKFLHMIYN